MKPLNLRQAHRCETSESSRCRCRCGGALHGAFRGLDAGFFHSLPDSDPHKALKRTEKKVKVKPPLAQMELFE